MHRRSRSPAFQFTITMDSSGDKVSGNKIFDGAEKSSRVSMIPQAHYFAEYCWQSAQSSVPQVGAGANMPLIIFYVAETSPAVEGVMVRAQPLAQRRER